MPRARWLPALAALLLGLASAPARCAPFLVPLGDTRVALEAPPGFSDTGFLGSPRIDELAQSLTSASNHILLFAITDADLRAFMNGDRPELRRYMIAVTPRGLARRSVSLDEFAAFVSDALHGLGKPPGEVDYAKYLDGRPAGQASLLAELRTEPEVVSVLQGTRLPSQGSSDEKPRYLLSTTTLLLLRGKALSASVYTGYGGPADLEWIKYATERWIEQLQRINRR
ncbi:MAG: hypothetical protein M0015_10020 [Betaproteobacteria bacterium]|nr:hypothetical protein [Betaproteobacteria bacterium]